MYIQRRYFIYLYRLAVYALAIIVVIYVALIIFEEGNRLVARGGLDALAGMILYVVALIVVLIALSYFIPPAAETIASLRKKEVE